MENSYEESTIMKVLKYFVHGLLFSILFTVLAVVIMVTAVFLAAIGGLIGLAIGICLLIVILGFTNAAITDFIWKVPTSSSLTSLFQHGFILFIVLLIVDTIPTIIINVYLSGAATTILVFLILCFVDGVVCRKVAEHWEEYSDEDSVRGLLAKIP